MEEWNIGNNIMWTPKVYRGLNNDTYLCCITKYLYSITKSWFEAYSEKLFFNFLLTFKNLQTNKCRVEAWWWLQYLA